MRVLTRTLAFCLGLVLATYGALSAPPVHAQTTDAPPAFTIQPEAGQSAEEVRRGYFWLAANPGQPRELQIAVKNTGTVPVSLRADPVDGVQVRAGGVDYGIVGKPIAHVGAWLTVQPERLTLAPGEARRITATLRVPDGATPGEHVGGVSVQDEKLQSQGTGTSVLIDVHYRQVLAVVVAVPGTLTPAMAIGEVTLVPAARGSRAVVELRNSGNVLLKGTGTVEIGEGQSGSGALQFAVGTLLPDATSLVPVDLPTVAVQPGIYDVRVRFVSDERQPLAAWDGKVTVGAPAAATANGESATTLLEPAQQLATASEGFPLLPVGVGIGIAIAGLALGARRGRRGSPAPSPATTPALPEDPRVVPPAARETSQPALPRAA